MKGTDTDQDGSIDLAEAQEAAGIVFDKIERDVDKTWIRMRRKAVYRSMNLQPAIRTIMATLTKDKYLALVAKRFRCGRSGRKASSTARS